MEALSAIRSACLSSRRRVGLGPAFEQLFPVLQKLTVDLELVLVVGWFAPPARNHEACIVYNLAILNNQSHKTGLQHRCVRIDFSRRRNGI
jgi:hypothetical protein